MKKYAHIKDGNVVLVLEYKDTSNYIDENIIEFDDSIGIGAYKIENGKVVLDIETTMRIGLKIIIDISDYIYNFYTYACMLMYYL